ncbi:hypothetical protein BDR04DRAFT_1172145 [Suillus decipiens]|nr:hypothetical protein BDR04DRAFT_1172145 [Suillus decipiens]
MPRSNGELPQDTKCVEDKLSRFKNAKDNIMEPYNIAAAPHRRRSRRGWHSGLDLGPPDPLHERLLATFAGALGSSPGRLYWPVPWIGHTGPCQLKTLVVSQVRARDERGIGGPCHPGRDLVVARDVEHWPCSAGAVSVPSRSPPQCPPGPGWHRHKQVYFLGAKRLKEPRLWGKHGVSDSQLPQLQATL